MILKNILNELKSVSDERTKTQNVKNGIGNNQFGAKLGVYRDYPVSKCCTSPFAPIWIKEMVNRQK